jgi:pimeloyl-ACP methyl ester carboxylesterase
MGDREWTRNGHDHGVGLAEILGLTPVYLRYNSGLLIPENGRAFARALETLLDAWPVPVTRLVILGYSMGGLVARSAHHYGREAGLSWPARLDAYVSLGTPHLGTPLAQRGDWVDRFIEFSPYSAPLAHMTKRRSGGLHDLRQGAVVDDVEATIALPEHVACHAIAGTRTEVARASDETGAEEPPRNALDTDGLVPVDSALGRADDPNRTLTFPDAHQWIAHGANHFDLLDRADVFDTMCAWLQATVPTSS